MTKIKSTFTKATTEILARAEVSDYRRVGWTAYCRYVGRNGYMQEVWEFTVSE